MKLDFNLQLKKGAFSLHAEANIPAESVTAIIGPSGAGKSTLLRCLAGLEPTVHGHIHAGEEHWLENKRSLSPHFRRIGFVFQHAALFEHLSVSQNLNYARKRALDSDRFTLEEIAQATRIEHLLSRSPENLSGGERQRVAIARAIASNPQLLLLDEPLSAVDEASRFQLSIELDRAFHAFKIPALYVTHNLAEAARLSNHAIRMVDGRITEAGPTSQILAPSSLSLDELNSPFSIVTIHSRRDLPGEGLVEIASAIGPLTIPASALPQDLPDRLLIRARDIGLSLSRIDQSSFLNQIPATVKTLQSQSASQTLVTLSCQEGTLHALVTHRSAKHLQLTPGSPVHALIKSVTLVDQDSTPTP
ncbi:molybdate ABC transporter, ATP-binding protein [Verrucomicrobiia bacterium DG1235]|nr:molybdate ABC transporter, ATP-binding protein [Verrucomicrobiae bacterium DG1235]